MLRYNIDVGDGLHNGSKGVVVKIDWEGEPPSISQRPLTRGRLLQNPDIAEAETPPSVLIKFDNPRVGLKAEGEIVGGTRAVRIKPLTLSFDLAGNQKCSRTQLPIIPAFACTIHKAQGLTLKKAVVDCGPSIFKGGMAYTALSRVRSLKDIILLEFEPKKIFCAPSVEEEFRRLEEEQRQPSRRSGRGIPGEIDEQAVDSEEQEAPRKESDYFEEDPQEVEE
jgi:hypothetical protein